MPARGEALNVLPTPRCTSPNTQLSFCSFCICCFPHIQGWKTFGFRQVRSLQLPFSPVHKTVLQFRFCFGHNYRSKGCLFIHCNTVRLTRFISCQNFLGIKLFSPIKSDITQNKTYTSLQSLVQNKIFYPAVF